MEKIYNSEAKDLTQYSFPKRLSKEMYFQTATWTCYLLPWQQANPPNFNELQQSAFIFVHEVRGWPGSPVNLHEATSPTRGFVLTTESSWLARVSNFFVLTWSRGSSRAPEKNRHTPVLSSFCQAVSYVVSQRKSHVWAKVRLRGGRKLLDECREHEKVRSGNIRAIILPAHDLQPETIRSW